MVQKILRINFYFKVFENEYRRSSKTTGLFYWFDFLILSVKK